jgi:hypothetical protein
VDKLKIQESEILLILYELRTKILKSDLDGKYKDPIAKQLDDSAELIKDQFAMEYFKLKKVGNGIEIPYDPKKSKLAGYGLSDHSSPSSIDT